MLIMSDYKSRSEMFPERNILLSTLPDVNEICSKASHWLMRELGQSSVSVCSDGSDRVDNKIS